MDKRIFHLREQLSQNLSRTWTVENMAAEAKMSVPHLHRLFREETGGLTPNAYLRDLQLVTMAKMLSDPNCFLRISEIGIAVGLTNESHVSQDFKAKYGVTPTQYRNAQDQIHQSRQPNVTEDR